MFLCHSNINFILLLLYMALREVDRFDVKEFNKVYNDYISKKKESILEQEERRLDRLNNMKEYIPLHQLSVGQHLINTKDTWFDILDDLLQFRFNIRTFNKQNRLFYIGLTLLIIATCTYIYKIMLE